MSTKKSVAKKTVAKKPVAKKPVAKKTVAKKPVAKKTAATTPKKAATKKAATTKAATTKTAAGPAVAATIVQRFAELGGWRGPLLAKMRSLILEADPELLEERKWIKPSNPHGVPTYSRGGLVLTLEVYTTYVKLTFAQGSKVDDPTGLFNASLLGLRRAIDLREGVSVDTAAFKKLVRAAVDFNLAKTKG